MRKRDTIEGVILSDNDTPSFYGHYSKGGVAPKLVCQWPNCNSFAIIEVRRGIQFEEWHALCITHKKSFYKLPSWTSVDWKLRQRRACNISSDTF